MHTSSCPGAPDISTLSVEAAGSSETFISMQNYVRHDITVEPTVSAVATSQNFFAISWVVKVICTDFSLLIFIRHC
jgi:hypothetical protein